MAWRQVVPFDPSKMGNKPGYCLQNVRLGFGIPSKYYDAKEAMEANKAAGTLHDVKDLPLNISVPVFVDTNSPYEHVIASDKGVFYSDGKKLTTINGLKCFGWGETLNGVRIVEFVEDPKPVEPEPTPVEDKTISYTYKKGDTFGQVIKDLGLNTSHGLWGPDGDVAYYTAQLNTQGITGNIPVGKTIKLTPRE